MKSRTTLELETPEGGHSLSINLVIDELGARLFIRVNETPYTVAIVEAQMLREICERFVYSQNNGPYTAMTLGQLR